jgi:hypothetical protein
MSIEKPSDQYLEALPGDNSAEEQRVTFKSWLFFLIGALINFNISFALAVIGQSRPSTQIALNTGGNGIWLINIPNVFQACLGPPIVSSEE